MASYTTFLYFAFLSVFLLHSVIAQTPQEYVNAHNRARANVATNPRLPPVTWDNTLANYARNYANQRIGDCALRHSSGPYGENLAKGSSSTFSGISAINMWVNERQYYNYASNTCASGQMCGHYTQVVWRNTVRIGCARVRCNDGWQFVTCNYAPRGNIIGQRPY